MGGPYAYNTADQVHNTMASGRYAPFWESLGSYELPAEFKSVYLGSSRNHYMVPEATKIELGGLQPQYLTFNPEAAGLSPNGDEDLDWVSFCFRLEPQCENRYIYGDRCFHWQGPLEAGDGGHLQDVQQKCIFRKSVYCL